ncbi:MAG: hypothetical protein IJZ07_03875 [Clostridia bacterium]|nr:hypothetical protein [Clostridia bacterium]
MSNQDNAFLGARQVLLVGLGGVGGRIVNTIMRDMPKERLPYTQAIAIDTDINDMNDLTYVPRDNKIVLASSPGSGKAITIGQYIQKNPGAKDWFITEGNAFQTLMGQSTKQGAKQIRMVSRLALSATAKYYNLENRITRIISKLNSSDGTVNRDSLLVMVVCSVSGGTGAGTVLQVPMFLEDIITKYFDASAVSMQCAMLLPNLFNQTQANGNYFKGQVNGYAVMRELQSLNNGKLHRFEYMKDYTEVNGEDSRNKAPYNFVLLFDNATSSGATINGSTDNTHIPNIASCLAEYIYGPASHKCTSQLDNTLATVYSSGGTAIYRAVGKSSLVYPDNIYKQYAVSNWILSSVSDEWLSPDAATNKRYLEAVKKSRDEGKKKPDKNTFKHTKYCEIINDVNTCKGTFFTEIRSQLVNNINGQTKHIADIFTKNITDKLDDLLMNDPEYSNNFDNLAEAIKQNKSKNTHTDAFKRLERSFNDFETLSGNFVDSVFCPSNALTKAFLNKETDNVCLYPFVRTRNLHPMAFRVFLYQLERIFKNYSEKAVKKVENEDILSLINQASSKNRNQTVEQQLDTKSGEYKQKLYKNVFSQMLVHVRELIIEIEAFFDDLNILKTKFEGVSASCLRSINSFDNETRTIVGSREGMIACWNDIKSQIHEGDAEGEDVVDNDISVKIDELIYTSYYKWIAAPGNQSKNDEGTDVFRPRTDYTKIVSEHLISSFYKKINEQHSKSFPADILKASIFDAYVTRAYRERAAANPKFNPDSFAFSVADAELEFESDTDTPTLAAEYLNRKLLNIVKKAEPLSGPLYAKNADEDYFARDLYFNKDILKKETEIDPYSETGTREVLKTAEFIPGVSTSSVDTFTVQSDPVENISKHQISCFSYTGGLELSDFENMQDPVSGTYDPTDGRCYYNAYRNYINAVMNTTKHNITPHLHKEWHLAGRLDDISDSHTDSVNANAAKAFVYGFLLKNMIRIVDNGYVNIGIANEPIFTDMPGALNGVIEFRPFTNVEHANFSPTKNQTNRILYEIFQYLRNMPELRTRIIKLGNKLIEEAKANKKGSVFSYSIQPEECAKCDVYETIIDVLDGFYQHARFSELHDEMKNDIKALGNMFGTLCDVTIDVCAAIYASPKDRLKAYQYFVDKLYDIAICDGDDNKISDDADKEALQISDTSVEAAMFEAMFNEETIETENSDSSKPFAKGGDFDRNAMNSRMEAYLNKN